MLTRVAKRFSTVGSVTILIFAAVFLGLLYLHGNRLVFNNDEGIILDAAARMLKGETPYRDFFGYMSPGSYWLQEAAFRLLGVSLAAGRVVVILDFAFECGILFWLTSRLAGRKAGFVAAILFFAFQAASPDFLLAQHRMDSAALSLASIALCLEGRHRERPWYWVVAGILVVGAAACTPSIGLLAPVTLVWLIADRPSRRFLVPYAAGLCAGSVAFASALAANGSIVPFIGQMTWLQRNYSDVNVMPYGSIIGGYGAALGASAGMERVVRSMVLFCVALPAVLPIVALAAWSLSMLLRPAERLWAARNAIPYLLASTIVYVASTYPRPDVAHLAFIAVLPAALTAVWLFRYAPSRVGTGLFALLVGFAGVFLAAAANGLRDEVALVTPVGALRATPSDAQAVDALLKTVRPADALYVHPYKPLFYFLTQARNPTRYSYLAPGMMTGKEEVDVLAALNNSPPKWLLHLPLTRDEFLRVFPHATRLNHSFPLIESWRQQEYTPVEPAVIVAGYRLYQRRPSTPPAP